MCTNICTYHRKILRESNTYRSTTTRESSIAYPHNCSTTREMLNIHNIMIMTQKRDEANCICLRTPHTHAVIQVRLSAYAKKEPALLLLWKQILIQLLSIFIFIERAIEWMQNNESRSTTAANTARYEYQSDIRANEALTYPAQGIRTEPSRGNFLQYINYL